MVVSVRMMNLSNISSYFASFNDHRYFEDQELKKEVYNRIKLKI